VQDEVRRQKTSAQDQGALLAVYDVPLLFENGMQDQFAAIVVVSCWPEQQLQRLQTRNSLTEQQAQERLAQQWPLQKKMTAAHFVIDNSTDLSATDLQAEAVLRQLQDLALKAKRK
jgi:dephospho-CoA kinase